jgi:ATP-dependent Lon protease
MGIRRLKSWKLPDGTLFPVSSSRIVSRSDEVTFVEDAVLKIIHDYTREAGVRNLERHIAAICRKGIVALNEKGWSHVVVTERWFVII